MLSKYTFNVVSCLMTCRWARDYTVHNGRCEDASYARIGLLHVEANHCFVLDHDDARIYLQLPTPWGKLRVGYVVCRGEEQIRQPEFYTNWQRTIRKHTSPETAVCRTEDIDF